MLINLRSVLSWLLPYYTVYMAQLISSIVQQQQQQQGFQFLFPNLAKDCCRTLIRLGSSLGEG